MTRSGAPVHGACGDGKTVTSAEFVQLSAAAAGNSAAERSKTNPLAIGKVQPGTSPLALKDVKLARAAGEELILVETRDSDYRFTGTIEIVKQQPT